VARATAVPATIPAKPAKKERAPKGQLMTWQAELAESAKEVMATEASSAGGNFFSLKAGRLSFNGLEFPDNELECIVLDSAFANTFYFNPYDADNPESPDCYALAYNEEGLAPHENCVAPQNSMCKGCPKNAFGSAERGRGKACGNTRRLLLLTPDMLENLKEATPAILKVSPTNIKSWAGYATQLAGVFKRPPFSVITKIKVVPDPDNQFHIVFSKTQEINDAKLLQALKAKREECRELNRLTEPYAPKEEVVAKPKGRGKKAAEPAKPAPKAKAKMQLPAAVPVKGGKKPKYT